MSKVQDVGMYVVAGHRNKDQVRVQTLLVVEVGVLGECTQITLPLGLQRTIENSMIQPRISRRRSSQCCRDVMNYNIIIISSSGNLVTGDGSQHIHDELDGSNNTTAAPLFLEMAPQKGMLYEGIAGPAEQSSTLLLLGVW